MSKNIVITGGLGYIGTELSKIYSGESWNNNITVIDKRFISERVNQLRKWRINFVQADILDKDVLKHYLKNSFLKPTRFLLLRPPIDNFCDSLSFNPSLVY